MSSNCYAQLRAIKKYASVLSLCSRLLDNSQGWYPHKGVKKISKTRELQNLRAFFGLSGGWEISALTSSFRVYDGFNGLRYAEDLSDIQAN